MWPENFAVDAPEESKWPGRPCALFPTIPTQIFIDAITVLLTVGFIVLAAVTDHVAQGEPVVSGHEIDAGEGSPSA